MSREQGNSAVNTKMDQDFFKYLPSEIILDILLRLPIRAIMICKFVCKPWLDLLKTPEFIKYHLSRSVQGLAVYESEGYLKPYKIFEFVDDVDLNCRWNKVFSFHLPYYYTAPHGSANGLLYLQGDCLCNPITRDYIMLPPPLAPGPRAQFLSSGFGVSKTTGQYKVVRVLIRRSQPAWVSRGIECQIYTVGTGLWRWIDFDAPFSFEENEREGVFLNGNLHWLAYMGSYISVSCLDLETESSSSCATPLLDFDKCRSLSVLRDCLCLCDNSEFSEGAAYEIDIWLMKGYEEKLWTKEFVIRKINLYQYIGYLFPFKIFEDGNILMEFEGNILYYSSKTKTIQEAGDMFGLESDGFSCPIVFTPSFLSLETFAMEDVTSF